MGIEEHLARYAYTQCRLMGELRPLVENLPIWRACYGRGVAERVEMMVKKRLKWVDESPERGRPADSRPIDEEVDDGY